MARRNRNKSSNEKLTKKDEQETKKFLTVVGISTLVLIVLVYFAMSNC